MRVDRIVHDLALPPPGVVHAKRRRNVALAAASLLQGQRASLTAIGRGLARRTSDKHRIKHVDRLLGNPHLQAERPAFFRAIARRILGDLRRPILLIDWTQLGKHVLALVVAVPVEGRALPIFVEAVGLPVPEHALRATERAVLRKLRLVLPHDARPILVGDAGFRSRFVRDVTAMGWDVVVRLRGQTHVRLDGEDWTPVRTIFAEATRTARDLGAGRVAKQAVATPCRLVLGPRPRKGPDRRRWYPPKRGPACGSAQKAAKEPYLLATTIADLDAAQLVGIYARRMRIEETFRDAKCARYGWSLDLVRSASTGATRDALPAGRHRHPHRHLARLRRRAARPPPRLPGQLDPPSARPVLVRARLPSRPATTPLETGRLCCAARHRHRTSVVTPSRKWGSVRVSPDRPPDTGAARARVADLTGTAHGGAAEGKEPGKETQARPLSEARRW